MFIIKSKQIPRRLFTQYITTLYPFTEYIMDERLVIWWNCYSHSIGWIMKLCFFLIAAALVVLATFTETNSLPSSYANPEHDDAWIMFKKQHGKEYRSSHHDQMR